MANNLKILSTGLFGIKDGKLGFETSNVSISLPNSPIAINNISFENSAIFKAVEKKIENIPTTIGTEKIKINLGCGTNIREDWINIDNYNRDLRTTNMDITNMQFPDNYADEMCARDVLEHITHRKTMSVLKEWFRVLKPGGKIYIQSPNLYGWANALMNGRHTPEHVMEHLFAHQDYPTNFHYTAFTIGMLKKMMEEVGFKNIRSLDEDEMTLKTDLDTNVHFWATK